jgi:hypothetical protein
MNFLDLKEKIQNCKEKKGGWNKDLLFGNNQTPDFFDEEELFKMNPKNKKIDILILFF